MATQSLHDLLEILVKKGGSDLHISSGSPPRMRIDGELIPANDVILTPVGVAFTLVLGAVVGDPSQAVVGGVT